MKYCVVRSTDSWDLKVAEYVEGSGLYWLAVDEDVEESWRTLLPDALDDSEEKAVERFVEVAQREIEIMEYEIDELREDIESARRLLL